MKTFTGSLIALLFSLTGFAQDWAPYVPGQVSVFLSLDRPQTYAMPYDTALAVRSLDTVIVRNHHTVYFFKSHSRASKLGQPGYCPSIITPDSMLFMNGRYTYYYNDGFYGPGPDSQNFYFDASVGTSWHVPQYPAFGEDSIRITVIDIRIDSFLGVVDSIKEFEVFIPWQDTGKLVISKNYGFIKGFLPLPGFPTWVWNTLEDPLSRIPYHQIVGIKGDSINIGDTIPRPRAFYPYTSGTILKWSHSESNTFGYYKTYQSRDSIIEISFTDSTIWIEKETKDNYHDTIRTRLSAWGFSLSDIQKSLKAHSNYYYIIDPMNWSEEVKTRSLGWYNSNGKYYYSLSMERFGGEVQNCAIQPGFAQEYFVGKLALYNTQYGYYHYADVDDNIGWYSYGSLIGYSSAAQFFGNISPVLPKPIGINTLKSKTFNFYPNPASSTIKLDLPSRVLQQGQLTIQDMLGRILIHGSLNGNPTVLVDQLQSGLYLISVIAEDQRYQAKLLIQ